MSDSDLVADSGSPSQGGQSGDGRSSRVLVTNVFVTFLRMGLTVGLGLLATRLLFQRLGVVDFGLFSLIGGSACLLATVGVSIRPGIIRHLAHAIGKNDMDEAAGVFSTGFVLLALISMVIAVAGYLLGPLIIQWLNIPDHRLVAALWVWRIAAIQLALALCFSAFSAVSAARENMSLIACMEGSRSVCRLLAVLLLGFIDADKMIAFATLWACFYTAISVLESVIVQVKYKESRLSLGKINRVDAGRIATFGGWRIVETASHLASSRIGAILVNIYFGAAANAALAISRRVNGYVMRAAGVVGRAASPTIIQKHARDETEAVSRLVVLVSAFCAVAALAAGGGILIDLSVLLKAWLGDVPDDALPFCVLGIGCLVANSLVAGHRSLVHATGRIGVVSAFSAIASLMQIIVVYVLFRFYAFPPPWLLAISLIGTVASSLFVLFYLSRVEGIPFMVWVRDVLLRLLAAALVGLCFALPWRLLLPQVFWRSLLAGGSFAAGVSITSWFLVLQSRERQRIRDLFLRKLRRVPQDPVSAAGSQAPDDVEE